MTEKRKVVILIILTIISCLISYFPFLNNLSTVGRYLDGPNYILVAKTLYYKITENNAFYMPVWYFACHLIGYPFFIRLLNYPFVPLAGKLSYLYSMLLSTVIFSVGATLIFYKFIKEFKLVKNPFYLAIVFIFSVGATLIFYKFIKEFKLAKDPFYLAVVFIFFPPRWLLYHSVGASEPEFIFWCLLSLYFFKKEKYWQAYFFGVLATVTRIFGVLLAPTYIILLLLKAKSSLRDSPGRTPFGQLLGVARSRTILCRAKRLLEGGSLFAVLGTLLMPLALFCHFFVYKFVFNMFWAYYQWNAGQLGKIPFGALLNFGKYWTPGVAELYVILMIFTIYGLIKIYKHKEIFWFSLIQFLPTTLNKQGDFSRFLTVITMFVWLVAFEDIFTHRYFKWVFPLYILLSYLYVWAAIPTNLIPPEVWINLIGDQV